MHKIMILMMISISLVLSGCQGDLAGKATDAFRGPDCNLIASFKDKCYEEPWKVLEKVKTQASYIRSDKGWGKCKGEELAEGAQSECYTCSVKGEKGMKVHYLGWLDSETFVKETFKAVCGIEPDVFHERKGMECDQLTKDENLEANKAVLDHHGTSSAAWVDKCFSRYKELLIASCQAYMNVEYDQATAEPLMEDVRLAGQKLNYLSGRTGFIKEYCPDVFAVMEKENAVALDELKEVCKTAPWDVLDQTGVDKFVNVCGHKPIANSIDYSEDNVCKEMNTKTSDPAVYGSAHVESHFSESTLDKYSFIC